MYLQYLKYKNNMLLFYPINTVDKVIDDSLSFSKSTANSGQEAHNVESIFRTVTNTLELITGGDTIN